MFIDTIRLTI